LQIHATGFYRFWLHHRPYVLPIRRADHQQDPDRPKSLQPDAYTLTGLRLAREKFASHMELDLLVLFKPA
jgi:hypothetical protein